MSESETFACSCCEKWYENKPGPGKWGTVTVSQFPENLFLLPASFSLSWFPILLSARERERSLWWERRPVSLFRSLPLKYEREKRCQHAYPACYHHVAGWLSRASVRTGFAFSSHILTFAQKKIQAHACSHQMIWAAAITCTFRFLLAHIFRCQRRHYQQQVCCPKFFSIPSIVFFFSSPAQSTRWEKVMLVNEAEVRKREEPGCKW